MPLPANWGWLFHNLDLIAINYPFGISLRRIKISGMIRKYWILFCCFCLLISRVDGQLTSGPMLGPVELRDAKVWIAVANAGDVSVLKLHKAGETAEKTFLPVKTSTFEFNTCVFNIVGLEPGTSYEYTIEVTDRKAKVYRRTGKLTTKTLFQWRNPAPDFSFITGSCAYFNEPQYDRPGKPYGLDSSIFETMAKEKSAFMLWLGDNWYTREVDFSSQWGLWYRANRERSMPVLQPLLSSMGHVAIWDDHDYGPNDYGKSYFLKNTSREIFSSFWLNPSCGDGRDGIYSRYQYNDVDFFLMDDRWWRDFENLPDSVNGLPNPNKKMFGRQQLDWLKEELRYSKGNPFISFRVIAIGSQVLNPVSPFDKLLRFPVEYYELIHFIRDEKIDGVLFFSGDRHHSEVIRVQPEGMYPLYDITCSPLSSGTHKFGGKEADNPYRVFALDELQNFGRISVSGERSKRKMQVEFVGKKGEPLGSWLVSEQELKIPR